MEPSAKRCECPPIDCLKASEIDLFVIQIHIAPLD